MKLLSEPEQELIVKYFTEPRLNEAELRELVGIVGLNDDRLTEIVTQRLSPENYRRVCSQIKEQS